jgi:hypothetical protein
VIAAALVLDVDPTPPEILADVLAPRGGLAVSP